MISTIAKVWAKCCRNKNKEEKTSKKNLTYLTFSQEFDLKINQHNNSQIQRLGNLFYKKYRLVLSKMISL